MLQIKDLLGVICIELLTLFAKEFVISEQRISALVFRNFQRLQEKLTLLWVIGFELENFSERKLKELEECKVLS